MTSLTNDRIYDRLTADIEAVKQIEIVPTMLEVVCRTTGMGFAAIARVTEDKWIACSVRDEIAFGLQPGGELKIETTICNEIRDSRRAVIIDNVPEDENFAHHHTPRIYGFQSYISFPIILKTGEFFGTLCAIDPKPAQLNNPRVTGMFALFAELLSFHLQNIDLMDRSRSALQESNRQLDFFQSENRQYRHISNHNLQEPLRKIKMFSDYMVTATEMADVDKAKQIALKINTSARELTSIIQDLTDFADLNEEEISFERVDLDKILLDICAQLSPMISEKNATIRREKLPTITAIPSQMAQLFFHLINNALKFAKSDIPPLIRIHSNNIAPHEINHPLPSGDKYNYCEIFIEDNGVGIEKSEMERIFDILVRLHRDRDSKRFGTGLAYCRKIVHNHGGIISARSVSGEGTSVSIILPVERIHANL